jgi:hypothetical protein
VQENSPHESGSDFLATDAAERTTDEMLPARCEQKIGMLSRGIIGGATNAAPSGRTRNALLIFREVLAGER